MSEPVPEHTSWYTHALRRLISVMEQIAAFSTARELEDLSELYDPFEPVEGEYRG